MAEPKYLVTKLDGTPVEDAVVIRRQDVFAPPALDAYANAMAVVIETLRSADVQYEGVRVDRLQEIADYFADQAAKAWTESRKLPD